MVLGKNVAKPHVFAPGAYPGPFLMLHSVNKPHRKPWGSVNKLQHCRSTAPENKNMALMHILNDVSEPNEEVSVRSVGGEKGFDISSPVTRMWKP